MADPCSSRHPTAGYRCTAGRGHAGRCRRIVTRRPMPGWPEREVVTWDRLRLIESDDFNEEDRET